MEKNLENIIKHSDRALTVRIKKQVAKEKFSADTTIGFSGGIFKLTPELITYVDFLCKRNKVSNVTLIDSNGNPILIENLENFLSDILDKYFMAVGKYQALYQDLINE